MHAQYDHPDWEATRKFRESFLLPWLNVEELKKDPFKLFALLHTRTKFPPSDWVSFDLKQTARSWFEGNPEVDYANYCVILYGPKYGNVAQWTREEAHRWDIAGFPRAQLILEAQSLLMTFLKKIVDIILDGIVDRGELISTKWLQLAEGGFRPSIGAESWSKFSNQAYYDPAFDLQRLIVSKYSGRMWGCMLSQY